MLQALEPEVGDRQDADAIAPEIRIALGDRSIAKDAAIADMADAGFEQADPDHIVPTTAVDGIAVSEMGVHADAIDYVIGRHYRMVFCLRCQGADHQQEGYQE